MASSHLTRLLFVISVMLALKVHSVLLSISRDATAPSMRLWAKICKPKVMRQILSLRCLSNSDRITRTSAVGKEPVIPSDNPLRRMNNDKVNAGIRLIEEDNDFLLLWKTSNVAVDEGEKINRPASVSVAEWVSNYLPAHKSTVVYRHLLSSALSGVVMVAKSQSGRDFFSKSTALSSAELTYEAVVHDADQVSGNRLAAELSLSVDVRLAAITKNQLHPSVISSASDNTQKQLDFKLIKSLSSGSHGMLSLITITYTGSSVVECLTPALIMDILLSAGLTCVKENNRPYLSLTQINFKGEKQLYIKEKTPSKFLKLMRREEILYGRISERNALLSPSVPAISTHTQTQGGVDSDESSKNILASNGLQGEVESVRALESVHFLGLEISVSDSALKPRNSSAVLVREAIAAIVRLREGESTQDISSSSSNSGSSSRNSNSDSNKKVRRILDLGCGSGALLLAVLAGLKTLSIRGLGVGIDMDMKALSAALINADRNGPFICSWVAADFGLLHTSSVRTAVANAVISCEGKGRDILTSKIETEAEAVQDDGLFDVIICNPPFLSSLAAAGRITREGDKVLVGGLTGMEPYIAICESVLKACNGATNNIQNESSDQIPLEPVNKISSGSGRLKKRSLLMRAKSSQLAATTPDASVAGSSLHVFYCLAGFITLSSCCPDVFD